MTDNTESYLIVVEYEDDTERKRAEYLLDNWDDGDIKSIRGLKRRVDGTDIAKVYDALVAKVPEEQISTYKIDPLNIEASSSSVTLDKRVATEPERVEWAMETLLKKRDALEDQADTYALYTKKGRATLRYTVETQDESTVLHIEIEGYGDAPDFLREYFNEELDYML